MAEAAPSGPWGLFGNALNRIVGPAIASAGTIAPTHLVHHVTGTAAIATITPRENGFGGLIVLIADAIWTWTAAGNIAVAGTVTAALGTVLFCYDPDVNKWYPSRVA